MPVYRRLGCLAAVLLLSLAACDSQPRGSVRFAAAVQQALSASDVTRVKVTISASDMTSSVLDLTKTGSTWGGLISDIPTGTNRTFLAEAFDSSSTKRFQGQTSGVTITANQTTAVAITLQELSPQPPYANEAPLIDSVVATTTTVQTSGSLSLTATAHDPNTGDTLTYAWTATGGTFSAATAATTSWTAPATTGIYPVTVTVTDSQGAAASISLSINVFRRHHRQRRPQRHLQPLADCLQGFRLSHPARRGTVHRRLRQRLRCGWGCPLLPVGRYLLRHLDECDCQRRLLRPLLRPGQRV